MSSLTIFVRLAVRDCHCNLLSILSQCAISSRITIHVVILQRILCKDFIVTLSLHQNTHGAHDIHLTGIFPLLSSRLTFCSQHIFHSGRKPYYFQAKNLLTISFRSLEFITEKSRALMLLIQLILSAIIDMVLMSPFENPLRTNMKHLKLVLMFEKLWTSPRNNYSIKLSLGIKFYPSILRLVLIV